MKMAHLVQESSRKVLVSFVVEDTNDAKSFAMKWYREDFHLSRKENLSEVELFIESNLRLYVSRKDEKCDVFLLRRDAKDDQNRHIIREHGMTIVAGL